MHDTPNSTSQPDLLTHRGKRERDVTITLKPPVPTSRYDLFHMKQKGNIKI